MHLRFLKADRSSFGVNVNQEQGRAIGLYDDGSTARRYPDILWPQNRIVSPWPNVQGILTPDADLIASGLNPFSGSSVDSLVNQVSQGSQVNPAVMRWVQDQIAERLNIVIIDAEATYYSYADRIVAMNVVKARATTDS